MAGKTNGAAAIITRDYPLASSRSPRTTAQTQRNSRQYYHLCFERDHPGVVFLKKTATAEEETRCLQWGVWSPSLVDKLPLVPATGISLERRRYLFKRIRQYYREESKDAVCPDPPLLIHQPPRDPPCAVYKESALKHTKKMDCCASVRSPLSFLNPMSRCTLHCILRRGCKGVGPGA